MYVNGETGQFWVIDYRLYDPDGDGQTKLDHIAAMLDGVTYSAVFLGGIIPIWDFRDESFAPINPDGSKINLKQLPFRTVLMDSWDATQKLMAQIDQLEKLYYCPLKTNRRVDNSGGRAPYVRVDELVWNSEDLQQGKLIRVTVSTHRTEFVATNNDSQTSTDAVQDVSGIRWQIEEFLKQLTGIEACVFVAKREFNESWAGRCICPPTLVAITSPVQCLFGLASKRSLTNECGKTVYQVKHGMLSDYLIEQLKHPSIQMNLA